MSTGVEACSPAKKPTPSAMIAKIAIGVMFLAVSFTGDLEASGRAVGIVLAAALIAWGLVPYFKAKKAQEAAAAVRVEAEIAQKNAPKKCPACGAMTKGDVCEFCGTALK